MSSSSSSCQPNNKLINTPSPLIIAHRGASAYLPEHTIGAYRLALELQANFIEPDLVPSRDGILFCLHAVDLTTTTNVQDIFESERMWFSPTANRTAYWTFNFTAAELEQLTVKQRLSGKRSPQWDGLYKIPRLEEALQVVLEYNQQRLPQLWPPSHSQSTVKGSPSRLQLHQAGIYVEFKDYTWLQQECDINLVHLFYQHLQTHAVLWKGLLQDRCFTHRPMLDQYYTAGLVVQSFDVQALQDFDTQWKRSNTLSTTAPQPPAVLLVDEQTCFHDSEDFWYQMGLSWRSFVHGIGADKRCLLPDDNDNNERGEEFRARAKEFQLAIHPWTERPEYEFVTSSFETVMEEIMYLFCHLRVEGIFTESVSTAVTAAHMSCDDYSHHSNNNKQQTGTAICYGSDQEASRYSNLASFVMGVFVAVCGSVWYHRKRQRRYGDGSAVPSADVTSDLELT